MNDESNKGDCYFTHNGMRFGQVLESVDLQNRLWPVAHIQKKEVRIRGNFGQSEFVYGPANAFESPSEAATPEPNNAFEALPIGLIEDDEGEQNDGEEERGVRRGFSMSAGHRRHNPYACRPALKQKIMTRYDIESTMGLRLQKSGNPLFKTGPAPLATVVDMDEDSDLDDDDDAENDEDAEGGDDSDYGGGEQNESVNALLVKIWESRVFPVIRRRFRNETERRDGLEQIKGALSLGMASSKTNISAF